MRGLSCWRRDMGVDRALRGRHNSQASVMASCSLITNSNLSASEIFERYSLQQYTRYRVDLS